MINVSFEFNYQVINGLTTEKTEKTAESHRDYSVSPGLKAGFQYFALKWSILSGLINLKLTYD